MKTREIGIDFKFVIPHISIRLDLLTLWTTVIKFADLGSVHIRIITTYKS